MSLSVKFWRIYREFETALVEEVRAYIRTCVVRCSLILDAREREAVSGAGDAITVSRLSILCLLENVSFAGNFHQLPPVLKTD